MCAVRSEKFNLFEYLNLTPNNKFLRAKWAQLRKQKKLENLFARYNTRESFVKIERLSAPELLLLSNTPVKKRSTRNKVKKRCVICKCVSEMTS